VRQRVVDGLDFRVRVGEDVELSAGIGNGGFDAFMNAIGKVVRRRGVTLPKLVDFEVRIPKGGKTDALTEATIAWQNGQGTFKTRGVHSNQVFAAMNATIRMLNMQMHKMSQGAV
ncbi:MAG TPA: alpha-isopropylmalate synthase regulatory domain-containing protein, partial [Gammaproteobacteria bacterium]|nr:alpha-isopropylmalate synthase regulatory domain-containing protein [Gammaproteobacteria bacterium]